MSTKVQPANDAGNDESSDDGDVVDPGEVLSRRQLAADYADCVRTRESWIRGRSSDRTVLAIRHENMPANIRGPVRNHVKWDDLGPLEFAVGVMVRELETAIHHGSLDPSIQQELARQIIDAAYAIGGLPRREKSLAMLSPNAASVCALFDVSQRVVAKLHHDGVTGAEAVARVALAVSYLRERQRADHEAFDAAEHRRTPDYVSIGRDAVVFRECFERALEEYLRASSANARALAMFEHFKGPWVGDEALRKALRKPVSKLDEFERGRTAEHVYYYASKPELVAQDTGPRTLADALALLRQLASA